MKVFGNHQQNKSFLYAIFLIDGRSYSDFQAIVVQRYASNAAYNVKLLLGVFGVDQRQTVYSSLGAIIMVVPAHSGSFARLEVCHVTYDVWAQMG